MRTVMEWLLSSQINRENHAPALLVASSRPSNTDNGIFAGTAASQSRDQSDEIDAASKHQHKPPIGHRCRILRCPKVVIPGRKQDRPRGIERKVRRRSKDTERGSFAEDMPKSTDESGGGFTRSYNSDSSTESDKDMPIHVQAAAAPTEKLPDIDWVLWIPCSPKNGDWKALSSLPHTVKISFVSKFNKDYLSKPHHVRSYICMLRFRIDALAWNRCVGHVAYKSSISRITWSKANGDRDSTCDLCFRKGRFCARLVRVGTVIKLAFFPLPQSTRINLKWNSLAFWACR
ncbi:Nn.00g090130.m01.CDS01 [Neocucurbitaria sp. VM-36]